LRWSWNTRNQSSKQPAAGSAAVCPSRPPSRIQEIKKKPVMRAPDVRRSKKRKKEPQDDEWVQYVIFVTSGASCHLTLFPTRSPSIWRCSSITWSSALADCSAPMEPYMMIQNRKKRTIPIWTCQQRHPRRRPRSMIRR
jgi:hypothetical protein